MSRKRYRGVVLTTTWLAGLAGHHTGDYLEQPHRAAMLKQEPGRRGRRALHRHVAGYSVVQLVMKLVAYRVAGVRVPARAVLAGQAVESGLHWVIDRGPALRRYADVTGRREFHDTNIGGVNGRMLMDQAAHQGLQVPLGAIVTALLTPAPQRHARRVRR